MTFESLEYIVALGEVTVAVGACVGVAFVLSANSKGELVVKNGGAKYEIANAALGGMHLTEPVISEPRTEPEEQRAAEAEDAEARAAAVDKLQTIKTRIGELIATFKREAFTWTWWPEDAVRRAGPYAEKFPWLPELVGPRKSAAKCRPWEEAAEKLMASRSYRVWIRQRLWYRFRELRSEQDGKERESDLRGHILRRVHRYLVGKSPELAAKATPEKPWMAVLLHFSRSQSTLADEEERSGRPTEPAVTTFNVSSRDLPENSQFRHLESREIGPEDGAAHRETAERLRQALSRLPDNERIVAELILIEHRSHEEIAELLSKPVKDVKKIWNTARQKLRDS